MFIAAREKSRLWLLLLVGVVATLLGQTHAQQIFEQLQPASGEIALPAPASTGDFYNADRYDASDCLLAAKGGFTGAGYRAYDDAAEAAYASIRGTRGDVGQIAQNLGLDASAVNTMKKHLFYGRHQIAVGPGETVFRRFSADADIAAHWQGAAAGTLTQSQQQWFRQLMSHELGERAFMGRGIPFRSANPAAWRTLHPSIGPVNVNVPVIPQAHFMAPPQP
ncbi:MAG: hypothetical protein ACKV19_26275 [Verrucomicrobiales bacterium]